MQLRLTDLAVWTVLATSALAKPIGIALDLTGKIPALTSTPIAQEYPVDVPCNNSTEAQNLYGGFPVCNPAWFSGVVATELDAKFLIWTSPSNQKAIEDNDVNEAVAATATISLANGASGVDGFPITYPEFRQCANIDPVENNGGFVLYWPTEAIYCFYSESNCVGERVCMIPHGPGSEYNTIIPATENMIKNGLRSSVVLPMMPKDGYKAPYTMNPFENYDY
ncbi:hypothetical protein K493DRAFT_392219 [Basidiobolus meristosporus CBS 931.73]|uniref:Uncharacterized protein n=1 Tax=Basidiobolus meristosporus CBS 931.73 TaxID=1314790 RepID=A0A1Y1WW19_9FUNG|nr:hypothetical protein K493DRAFT_392219 [Basidiobolus meristosporus CBS 931.73]|eukprot:ORX77730.1 hypothetical protein K493DRAFT_392219 [Basidiobolus meristosporus CBS 931.73]